MADYPRSVLFRFAGAIAGAAVWLGLIVLALTNFDTPAGLPEEISATWPFWLVAAVVVVIVFLVRRRLGPGPGWGAFVIGFIAPFFALLANAQTTNAVWFWIVLAAFILVPLPSLGRSR